MSELNDLRFYSVADAKKYFSKVIEESSLNDIIITKNGKPSSAIISYEKYLQINKFLEEIEDIYEMDTGKEEVQKQIDFNDKSTEV
jgi:prevent-host-death family protein